ncbi:hypothetical protein Z517_02911 [Fonsecaea pedrosoi CBS 271.37]|uniref:Autophagy-related protein 14 n=1 Tax=Fonsecaea pedrosoi CBS 271.37 TaxID=1442368 RepID=A0A0D2GYG1_9EURO|nr:uncharacterized protein Z517_02911 [Fonsecaea pedrosoi CBS 271.37]KIW83665.1 hypothetical protein Z517_02911 [Fonsecaea pedrosoi CBS 271.37]
MSQPRRSRPSLSLRSLRDRFLVSETAPPPKSLDAEVKDDETTEHEIEIPLTSTGSSTDSTYINVETVKMDCPVCHKHLAEDTSVNCANCVNNLLYNCRFDLARVLLEKESLGKKVEAIVGPEPEQPLDEETARLRKAWQRQQERIEEQRAKEQEEDMQRELVVRQKELQEKKEHAEALKKNLEERRANLAAAKQAQARNYKKRMEELKENGEKLKAQYDALHEKTVDTRAILCREAAGLLRLHHSRKKTKNGAIKDRHSIAGLLLPDLKEINNMRCTELTAALANVTRLIFLCSFYLGIRLPAEITLPHRDYPLATINPPLTSYLGQRITFPGSGSSLSAPGSPTASRMDLSSSPKPRPLYIGSDDHNESVAQFAKKEPLAFSYFIEGVSLLAWDVAWLSRTQGFVAGTETWEDACDIGRNLFQMILAPAQSTAVTRVLTQRNARNRHHRSQSTSSPVIDDKANAFPARLGSYSHNSAHTFLGSATAAGDNPSRHWHLNRYSKISDPLKKHLLAEMNNAEWELLDQQEWNDGGEKMDEAVFIKTRPMDGKEYDDARSIMTPGGEEEGVRGKGKSGWTKLKNREKE